MHPKRTDGADIRAGITIDQIAALKIGQETPLLQKVIGDDTPKHILSQLAEIDAVERARPQPARAPAA